MGRKKGFTLVELLAVIVILSLISLITIPVVLNVVENSRLSAAKISGFNYVKAVNDEIQTNDMEDDSKEFEDGKLYKKYPKAFDYNKDLMDGIFTFGIKKNILLNKKNGGNN